MRRVLPILVSTALLGALGLSAVASAHGDGDHMHFIARPTSVEKSDIGSGSGKQIVMTFDVFEHHHDGKTSAQDHDAGERAGHGVTTCVTSDSDHGVLCSGSVELDEGQLSASGVVHHHSDDQDSVKLPVTGGSGRFFGAAGEVEVSHADDSDPNEPSDGAVQHADHDGGDMGDHEIHLTFHLE